MAGSEIAARQNASFVRKERGVALVITLILLAVITFMAVTFLVVSRGEKNQVGTQKDQTMASDAANAGTEMALAQMIAPAIAFTNPYLSGLLVSTNYQYAPGFIKNIAGITNVNYNYPDGTFITGNDFLQNQVNLQILPRPPVFVSTNTGNSKGPLEFRFYLDANRNGRYDTNGLLPVMNPNGGFYDTNGNLIANIIPGNTSSNLLVGDPEWVGLLEKPGFPHSATNRFVARYAYIVIPADQTLDLNYIHNQAKLLGTKVDGYLRNEGVGAWEINLAGFLTDLNTNLWASAPYGSRYIYNTNLAQRSTGAAFDDALQLVLYRYNGTYKNLYNVQRMFGNPGVTAFQNDGVDGYTDGPLMTGFGLPFDNDQPANIARPWPGSDNPAHFFTTQDLYDPLKVNTLNLPFSFVDRLNIAGTNTGTYDRYSFYRMLAQLGTDSAADPPNRMNLNYDNLVQSTNGVISATNFIAWRPIDFFANAANRLFTNAGFNLSIAGFAPGAINKNSGASGIQIYPTNFYSASVHRLLQLAANIFDASNTNGTPTNHFPTVFRPVFQTVTGAKGSPPMVFISGYQEVTDDSMVALPPKFHDLSNPADRTVQPLEMVYGVPLVIGAKKGFPNFNEFAMQTMVSVTRKLEFYRPPGSAGPPEVPFVGETNQMYVVYITNNFGVEAWNSYSNTYGGNLRMATYVDMLATITNEFGQTLLTNWVVRGNDYLSTPAWGPFVSKDNFRLSFKTPFNPIFPTNTFYFLTNSSYDPFSHRFGLLTSQFANVPSARFQVPHWWLILRARLRFALVDTSVTPHRIVDYANLDSTEDPVDITYQLMKDGNCGDANSNYQSPNPVTDGDMWCTNRGPGVVDPSVPTFGIRNQIAVDAGSADPPNNNWDNYQTEFLPGFDRCAARNYFRKCLTGAGPICTPNNPLNPTNHFFSPLNPTRNIFYTISWQANDPLVHYTLGDLRNLVRTNSVELDAVTQTPLDNIGKINSRYEPWTDSLPGSSTSDTMFDLTLKDPGVTRSDDWDFPINKLPNVGWLGRVHRGTPWQTVYLKAPIQNPGKWKTWSGNPYLVQNVGQVRPDVLAYNSTIDDSILTQPWRDRYLLDVFTTSFNENSARGRMSINQTNLASWSAILSGVIAITNTAPDSDLGLSPPLPQYSPWVIDPAGIYNPAQPPALVKIVQGIIRTRADTNLFPQGVFTHLGDILSVPELTIGGTFIGTYPKGYWYVGSPFLNLGNTNGIYPGANTPKLRMPTQQLHGLNDEAIERIPQQILGLLRLDPAPRYVIYSFGQTLKPADHSLVTAGPYFGLCTNYQVTAEAAIRTVIRIEGSPTNSHAVFESFNPLPAQ